MLVNDHFTVHSAAMGAGVFALISHFLQPIPALQNLASLVAICAGIYSMYKAHRK